jgi:hypothetical protein
LGRINAGAALHAGLGWAQKPKPGLILRTNSQRGVIHGQCRRPPLFAGRLRGFYGISLGFRAGFTAALRDAQILAPRGYVSDK